MRAHPLLLECAIANVCVSVYAYVHVWNYIHSLLMHHNQPV